MPDNELTAEALNGLGAVQFERGDTAAAQRHSSRHWRSAGTDPRCAAGSSRTWASSRTSVATIEALACYEQSLEAFRTAGDTRMCAVAYHNLGMINADQEQWAAADGYFEASLEIAEALGDRQLLGQVLLNRTEVHLACQRYEDARRSAEEHSALRSAGCATREVPGVQVSGDVTATPGHRRSRKPGSSLRSRWPARAARCSTKPRRPASSRSCTSDWTATTKHFDCSMGRTASSPGGCRGDKTSAAEWRRSRALSGSRRRVGSVD